MSSRHTQGGGARTATGSSPEAHEAVTPHDTNGFTGGEARGLFIGTGGDVSAVIKGVTVVYKNLANGSQLPGHFTRVNATNTTATDIVAWF